MGGDFGPSVTVPAALQALNSNSQLTLLLVGDPDTITPLLAKADFEQRSRLQIIPAQSVIASDARPSQAIRASRGSSMRVALELVKEGQAQACVSAGNTGALMGLAKLLLKPLEGIERPALVTVLPHQQKGKTVVLDLGANVDCDSTMLVQFAVMGSVLAEEVVGIANPRVALLNIGEEEITAKTDLAFVGIMPNENVKITEVWENKKAELNDNTIISTVPPHGVKLFEIVL